MPNILPRAPCVPGGMHARRARSVCLKSNFALRNSAFYISVGAIASLFQLCISFHRRAAAFFSFSLLLVTACAFRSLDCCTAPFLLLGKGEREKRCLARVRFGHLSFAKASEEVSKRQRLRQFQRWNRLKERSSGRRVHPSRCKRSDSVAVR